VEQVDATVAAPLLLGGSTLLLCGLLQPLAALLRTAPEVPAPLPPDLEVMEPPVLRLVPLPAPKTDAPSTTEDGAGEAPPMASDAPASASGVEEEPVEASGAGPETAPPEQRGSWRSGILLALLLVFAAPYTAILALGEAIMLWPAAGSAALLVAERDPLIAAGLRVGLAVLMLGFASRAFRRIAAHPPFNSMPPTQPGWALPLGGLADVVAPLTPGFWAGLGRSHPRRAVVLLGAGLVAGLAAIWWGRMWRP
jgi:hypothetical protein